MKDRLEARLRECGVNYLHLMPLLKTVKNRSDGGYAVADFRMVQPELEKKGALLLSG